MTTTRELAKYAATLTALCALALAGCPDTGGDDAVCGNNEVEFPEDCDDGNTISGDGCSDTCQAEGFCGNGVREPLEECDDGNYQPGDGCDADCNVEVGCGNGILDVGESCDDDNTVSGDGCSATCVDEEPGAVCGNGIWETSEGCEDGNTEDGDGCSATCQREDSCGDGVLDAGEECDDGNNISGDGCLYDCRTEFVPNDGFCDVDNNESCAYSPADCCPECGNGVLQTEDGEQCDDGNNVDGDGCSSGCVDEVPGAECGNGIHEIGEGCDDGNTTPQDGCDANCVAEFDCNDGVCETANHESCALCPAPSDCCPDCGDGDLDPGEQCDGADFGGIVCEDYCYTGGTLTCTSNCQIDAATCSGTLPSCGDNSAGCGEECDGSDLRGLDCQALGFESGTLDCGSGCTYDTSGCTNRLWYLNEGFEAGLGVNWTAHGMWEVGAPASVGPAAAHDGSQCAGTRIAADYDSSGSFAFDWLETPRIDLTGATAPVLLFYAWLSSESNIDGGNLRISSDGGASFAAIPSSNVQPAYNGDAIAGEDGWTGASPSWRPVIVNLGPWAGSEVVIRFAFASDAANVDAGWYVDDVFVAEAADIPVQITTNDPLPTAVTNYAYDVTLDVLGGSGTYAWTIEGGTNHTWLNIDGSTGQLTGTPDASDVGPVTVTVRVEDTANTANFDERTFNLAVLNALYFEDFEGSAAPSDWNNLGGGVGAFWEWGTPSTVGPPAAYGGSSCIGTTIAGDYVGFSCFMPVCYVETPSIDLAGTTAPVLTFWHYVHFGNATDGGSVYVNGTQVANPVPAYNGTTGTMGMGGPGWTGDLSGLGWHQVTVDLSSYAGQSVVISFEVATDLTASGVGPGWYIDDVLIAD